MGRVDAREALDSCMMFARKAPVLRRILIVEDEPLIAFDTEHFLEDEGFQIVATIDRADAAEALIEDGVPLDLVIVDVALAGGGSGVDVARAAFDAGIRVLFVTGACPPEARLLADGCLAKPYSQRHLLAAIKAIGQVAEGERPRKLPSGFSLYRAA